MIEPSLQLGGGNWANKSDSLLGYHKDGANFYADELTFSRNSLGSYTDANGLIQSMPYNLLQYSNSFDTTWLSNGTTETSGQSGYDGSNNAWLLQRNDGLARFVYQNISITNTSTFSVYAKAGNVNWIYFNNGSGVSVYFDLLNGAVGSITGGNTASIESVGNGWYRCSAILTNGSENRIYPAISNNVVSGLVGANIYIQDAQLNQGSTALPYFATTTRLNLARVDYKDNINGSLLLEPQRTNLLTYSSEFDNAAWTKTGVTISANATTSPDGTNNADKLVGAASAGDKIAFQVKTITIGQAFTISAFYKKSEYKLAFLRAGGQTDSPYVIYNLDTQAVVSTSGASSTKIEDYSNGWYRVSLTLNSATSATCAPNLSFAPDSGYTLSGLNVPQYTGDGTSGGFIWGCQLEANGASYPTSYIHTTSTAVTRVADSCSKTGISDKIGQTEGTIFMDFIAETTTTSQSHIWLGAVGSEIGVYGASSFQFYSSGGVNIGAGAFVTGQRYKIAFGYKLNDYVVYVNGVLKGTDTSATVPTTSAVYVNSYSDFSEIQNKQVNEVLLFPTRLTNAELATLTTL